MVNCDIVGLLWKLKRCDLSVENSAERCRKTAKRGEMTDVMKMKLWSTSTILTVIFIFTTISIKHGKTRNMLGIQHCTRQRLHTGFDIGGCSKTFTSSIFLSVLHSIYSFLIAPMLLQAGTCRNWLIGNNFWGGFVSLEVGWRFFVSDSC